MPSCSDDGGDDDAVQGLAALYRWNQAAIDASGLDHQPPGPGDTHTFGQQLGPCRASRAMGIVHIAMFESVNAIFGGFTSYVSLAPATTDGSVVAAVAQAAHDTLVALYPSQAPTFDALLTQELAAIADGPFETSGTTIGAAAAAAILAARVGDGSNHSEPVVGVGFTPNMNPGFWRPDPVSGLSVALGAQWPTVVPFAMNSGSQFRIPPPPALTSAFYAAAYDEVKALGGDGTTTATVRNSEGTFVGIFWAYDGTPSLCAPPRLYNQLAVQVAKDRNLDIVDAARLLGLVNTAMADTGIAAWDSKYFYQFWRPVTGIRESDPGSGPTGLGDGNGSTVGDAAYSPLGAPASNTTNVNFTPPFPAYPSGHAAFGGALFQVLRRFFGTDDVTFTFISDEYDGVTRDNQGIVRPFIPRTFNSFSEAEEENGQSRIFLGIHWSFDKTEGITQGNNVGDLVFDNVFVPVP